MKLKSKVELKVTAALWPVAEASVPTAAILKLYFPTLPLSTTT